jgi:hypothetical protein
MIDMRVRNKTQPEELEPKKGKLLTDSDYNVLLTGPTRVARPDGKPLCVYLPGTLRSRMDELYEILSGIRLQTDNRGLASGTKRINAGGNRTRAMPIHSGMLGAMDASPRRPYCRLNAYNRKHLEKWEALFPLFSQMSGLFASHVPDRWRNQYEVVSKTHEDWVIPGTVFTTITINNSYSTGVHTDKGDLDEGFSCLAVARNRRYGGGRLVFPEYRVAVDMQHGDLLLMDAHDWHGNTQMICDCGKPLNRRCETCGAERISVVAYYRTNMKECGSSAEEALKYDQMLQVAGS